MTAPHYILGPYGQPAHARALTLSQTARFAKRVFPHIQGRVLAQTSPRNAYDKDKIVAHARAYAKAYNAEGISK